MAWRLRRYSTAYRRSSSISRQRCHFEASRSFTALEQDSTIIALSETSQSKWLVAEVGSWG
jgi:hypothetical protein